MLQTSPGRSHAMVAIILLAMATTGCIVLPVRIATRIDGPARLKVRLPKEAPVRGKTSRQEMEEHYEAIAVETGVPNLLWGRFRKSTWAIVVAAGGGYYGAIGGHECCS